MASSEINDPNYNADLGMRVIGRPHTFTKDLFVGGNLTVAGAIVEGSALPPSDDEVVSGCPSRLKIEGDFRVEGNSCMEKGLYIQDELRVESDASVNNLKVRANLDVLGGAKVASDLFVSGKTQLSDDTQVLGKLHVGSGNVSCANANLTEAQFFVNGVVYAEDTIFCPDLSSSGGVYSNKVKTDSLETTQIIVNGKVYQEQSIEVTQGGVPVTLNVLVAVANSTLQNPPNQPRVCPITVPQPIAPDPAPPCPTIDC